MRAAFPGLLLLLGGCHKAPDFDARFANRQAAIETAANRMDAELARRIEAANAAAPEGENWQAQP